MVRPFRRKSGKEQPPPLDDEDLVGVVDDDSIEPNSEIDLTRTKAEISEIEAISDEDEIETKDDITKLLKNSSQTVVCTCLDIRRADNVLIVCDPTTGEIGQSLHEAAIERTDRVLLIVMPKGRHHGDEPPTPVANLMRQQSVIIAPTRYSLTHTKAIRQALKDGARVATMPGMNVEMFTKGGISADFTEIKRKISDLSPLFRRKRIVNVKSDNGTDVTFEVNWREWKMDDNGICNRPKMLTNLPAGKVFVLPRENSNQNSSIDSIPSNPDLELMRNQAATQIQRRMRGRQTRQNRNYTRRNVGLHSINPTMRERFRRFTDHNRILDENDPLSGYLHDVYFPPKMSSLSSQSKSKRKVAKRTKKKRNQRNRY